jgi:hypothetical protein
LAVRARFSRDWNLVDFLAYLIGYLKKNQPVMAFSGIESGIAEAPPTHFKWYVRNGRNRPILLKKSASVVTAEKYASEIEIRVLRRRVGAQI